VKYTETVGYIIDLDGTVYTGNKLIAGARESISYLQSNHIPFVFLSNRGNYSRLMCQAKLKTLGIEVPIEQIGLSSTVTARFLQSYYKSDLIWTLGDNGLTEELQSHGLQLAEEPELSDWLVITLHEQLTYHELNQAFRAARAGARIIATNEDRSFPRHDGECIDVAGMIGAITHASGRTVDLVMGKPSQLMAEAALDQLGLNAEQCIVIGDSLTSDIQLAHRHHMQSVLVHSGSTTKKQIERRSLEPDWIAADMWSFFTHYYNLTGDGYIDRQVAD